MQKRESYQQKANDAVLRVFLAYDRDRSMSIDVRELKAALDELGLPAVGAEVDQILAKYNTPGSNSSGGGHQPQRASGSRRVLSLHRYDRDHNGVLDLKEFRILAAELEAFQKSARGTRHRATPNRWPPPTHACAS